MFRFVASLFGCPHRRCTFPITSSKKAGAGSQANGRGSHATYIVCLECGQEFPYDWKRMKLGRRATTAA
jgi:RNase P subunit RPR2